MRARGARLVRDCAAVFGLSADDLLDGGIRPQVGFQQACLNSLPELQHELSSKDSCFPRSGMAELLCDLGRALLRTEPASLIHDGTMHYESRRPAS